MFNLLQTLHSILRIVCRLQTFPLTEQVLIILFNPAESTKLVIAMSASLIGNMPPSAAQGWKNTTLKVLTGCAGFTVDQFNQVPFSAYTGWVSSCVSNLITDIFAMTSDQLAYLDLNVLLK